MGAVDEIKTEDEKLAELIASARLRIQGLLRFEMSEEELLIAYLLDALTAKDASTLGTEGIAWGNGYAAGLARKARGSE